MNTLERTLIEKAGYAHGWKNVRESTPERVIMYSARHKAEAHVTPTDKAMIWQVNFPKGPPTAELVRSLPEQHTSSVTFQATGKGVEFKPFPVGFPSRLSNQRRSKKQ